MAAGGKDAQENPETEDQLKEWFEELPSERSPGLKRRGRPSLTEGAEAQFAFPSVPTAEIENQFDREEAELSELMVPILNRVNSILLAFKNRTLRSFESNSAAVERINRLIDCCGLVLLYDKKPVRLRCFRAPGSRAGQIQARLTGRSGAPVWNRNIFPPLEAFPRFSLAKKCDPS